MNIRTLASLAVPSVLLFGAIASPAKAFNLTPLGTYETGRFDEGAAEIAAFAPGVNRLFVTNADANTIDVLDISDPTSISKLFEIDLSTYGDGINSVAYNSYDGFSYIAAAVEADPSQAPGSVVFFDLDGIFQNALTVGSLPDMVTFTPDGKKLLVANEGEPNDDYTVDPEGSVSIIDVSGGLLGLTDADVKFADFNAFESQKDALMDQGLRIYGPGATLSQDLEPEYIAVSEDNKKAYVSLQENNALGILNLETDQFEAIVPLSTKDHSLPENALDASDEDGINIQTLPIFGIYQPDAIATYTVGDTTYVVTANEGDARDYDEYSEEADLGDLIEDGLLDLNDDGVPDDETTVINPATGETVDDLNTDDKLGEIDFTIASGDVDGDGLIEELTVFGARSFSIWDEEGNLVWDSGDQFEQILASQLPENFNATNDENQSFDNRSDNKGPEPEGITIGQIGDKTYAFIGLERVGGIMMYDVTDPTAPTFVTYTNNRNFDVEFDVDEDGDPDPTAEQLSAVLDLGPEGLAFIKAADSPTGKDLLAVTNEVSGTTTIYSVEDGETPESVPEPATLLGLLTVVSLGGLGLKRQR